MCGQFMLPLVVQSQVHVPITPLPMLSATTRAAKAARSIFVRGMTPLLERQIALPLVLGQT